MPRQAPASPSGQDLASGPRQAPATPPAPSPVSPRKGSLEPRQDLPEEVVDSTARILRCLGHPLRLRILDLLSRRGECTVTEVQEALHLEQAICSQHLNLMRDKGILARRKEGVHVFYRTADPRALKVLACLRASSRPD